MSFQSHTVAPNGVDLHVRTFGPEDGYPILLLHGWPDSSRCWERVAPLLGGFRLVMPDQRAFGRSGMPEGVDAYRMQAILGDALGLLDWVGAPKASIVGHDFGGAVAWQAAAWLPDRFDAGVVIASPHPGRFREVAAGNLTQVMKGFYAWLMQTDDGLSLLTQDDARFMATFAFGTAIPPEEVEEYRLEWTAVPGRLAAMANWYRANYSPAFLDPGNEVSIRPARIPIRYVHGAKDFAFVPELATGSAAHTEGAFDEHVLEDASHWMPQTHPERIAELIRGWVERH
ncbi:MAG: alpha/beta fold hydrolase, partial [Acidimicrobiia bacterium]|nr:alpha/beta fold hydrolase [Acidimicrobiia bacterium]